MKFARYPRYERFAWTSRKLAAASSRGDRARALEAERLPLLADQLPPPAPFDPDAEGQLRDLHLQQCEARMRALHARVWRESRHDARAATPAQQLAIRDAWEAWRGPRTAPYFRYVVDLHTGVMAQRAKVFGDRELAVREELLRSLRAQGSLDFEDDG